jgi:phosphate transport system substrate-binding protein
MIQTQPMNKRILTIFLTLALAATAVGCGRSDGEARISAAGELKGTITVSGAWALYPLMVRWGEEFHKLHPGVEFDISAGGAGKGMSDALAGAVDIGMVSRAVKPEEEAKGAFWIAVTRDAVFLAVSADNPVWQDLHQKGVTRETLVGIYITGEVTTWGQVVGRPEVDDPIHAYTRSDACGAAETWAKYLDGQQEDLLGIAVYGDPGLLEAVVKDALGIGYNNLNYAFDMATGLPDTKEQAVSAVSMGRYPSPPARDLNLVTQGQPEGLVKAFITWILTDGQRYVDEAGYIALPKDELDQGLQKLD